ncbi:histidine kinase N-terminal domain-containing protein [Alkalihalobacillus sp. AL-G]|uniref:histidine kinase N-terminal domain-containing protein n=1 Tax=Alkalihalobacillus sp. AL-G TaxID=2926399 RepID=UPI00272D96F1|nr:histidine kinase N-terminal domain-containing protein [Alkalihalobacillus sp. AL-G]WLD94872.1 ATP-binding protein [Alkalihalobacillus sp. AL-G]
MKVRHEMNEEDTQQLIKLFHTQHNTILDEWLNVVAISENDPFYEEVINNGGHTIRLITTYLKDPETPMIQNLTKKVARERIEAQVDIGEFITNINMGRSIVYRVLNKSDVPQDKQLKFLLMINDFFDLYMYHAVTEYSNLKDSIIQKKSRFIQEMHSDRLSILGQIAASFAHEFRNPLTSIKGFIQLIEMETPKDGEVASYFKIINREMESLQEKISQFLYLSKMKGIDDESESFSLTEVIRNMLAFLYPRFVDEHITIDSDINGQLTMFGVEEQLKQVVLNILNNAVEELSETDGDRVIHVSLTNNGSELFLKITNSGSKIPEHLLEDIFEPFISTKQLGTGLGLSVCKQIVEKHRGMIQVDSTEKETSFLMTFPLAEAKGIY